MTREDLTMSKQHKIGIVGYGYLGKSLHESLAGKGIDVTRIYNRSGLINFVHAPGIALSQLQVQSQGVEAAFADTTGQGERVGVGPNVYIMATRFTSSTTPR